MLWSDKDGKKCKSLNKYDCSALEASEATEDKGNVNTPSTPTDAQIASGMV